MSLEFETLNNGWTTKIHTPIKDLTKENCYSVIDLLIENTCVIWNKQELSKQDELDFISRLGSYEYSDMIWNNLDEESKSLFYPDYPGLMRVTGAPGLTGSPGQFGHTEELAWHCDGPTNIKRSPFVYLYAVEGSAGSVTHWTNGIKAYQGLDPIDKHFMETFEVQYYGQRYRKDLNTKQGKWRLKEDQKLKELNLRHKIVIENKLGQKGLAVSPLQVGEVTGMNHEEMLKFTEKLLAFLTKPEYVYSHHWQDGDVAISDQFFGIHKRDQFNGMNARLLHRLAFDPSNSKED